MFEAFFVEEDKIILKLSGSIMPNLTLKLGLTPRQHKAQVETVVQILLFFCDHNLELETEMRFFPKCLIIVDYPTLVENYWRSIKLQF